LPVVAAGVAYDILLRYFGPVQQDRLLDDGKYLGLRDGMVALEVGAFTGFHALRLAELTGPNGRVVAVEAVPENLALLRRNVHANPDLTITVVPMAAWSARDRIQFQREGRQAASALPGVVSASETLEVDADTIDAILNDLDITRVDFVRIQVNGAEMRVLDGMARTLRSRPIVVVAAIYKVGGEPSWQAVSERLRGLGYAVQVRSGNVFALPHSDNHGDSGG
jgi:FkbM family methyltransferase